MTWLTRLDFSVLYWIQKTMRCTVLDYFMPKITFLGDAGLIWLLLTVVLLFLPKHRRTGILLLTGLAFGALVGNLALKPLFFRARPCWLDPTVRLLISVPRDYSFPSGHTIASFEFATVLFLRERKAGIIALVAAVLISFSRMYLYLHFPSDVFTSVVLGILFGILGVVIVNALWKRFAGDEKKAEL